MVAAEQDGCVAVSESEATVIGGRYRLLEKVGRTGSGVVWAAQDARSGQSVAARVLERGLDDANRVFHFLAAARAAARLEHPSIARVLDDGIDKGRPFIVTEWVAGHPLSAWRGGPASPGFARAVVLQIARALAHIHAAGLVHLDLRPGSVLVTRSSEGPSVCVVDVGCARLDDYLGDRPIGAKVTLKFQGSIRYMAPEVASAPPWQIGAWSDLYSLGLMAWELLTGHPPDPDVDGVKLLLRRAKSAPPELPSHAGGHNHLRYATLLQRLLAREPADRVQTAAQLVHALDSVDEPPTWHPPVRPLRHIRPPFDHSRAATDRFPLVRLAPGPFVGRDHELKAAWTVLGSVVSQSQSGLVVVEGPPGSGRSRFVRELARHASAQGCARYWRVDFRANQAPGAALCATLESLLRASGTNARGVRARASAVPLLLGAEAEGLEHILTGLLRPDMTQGIRVGSEAESGAALGPITWAGMMREFFLELARRAARCETLIVWLDDVHWACDLEGLGLIRRILEEQGTAICVIATVDPTASGAPNLDRSVGHPAGDGGPTQSPRDALAEVASHLRDRTQTDDPTGQPRMVWVRLGPLKTRDATLYLAQRLALDPADVPAVLQACGHDAARLRWLSDYLLDGRVLPGPRGNRIVEGVELPDTLEALLAERVQGLPSSGVDALIPDVVQGISHGLLPLTPSVLGALFQTDPDQPWHQALAAAERAGLMTRNFCGTWVFEHGAVHQWLRSNSGSRSTYWHRQWLHAVGALEGRRRGRYGLERAAHAQAIGDNVAALTALQQEARWILGPGQPALERGLAACRSAQIIADAQRDVTRALGVLRLQAEIERQLGHTRAAGETLGRIKARLSTAPSPDNEAWSLVITGRLHLDEGACDRAIDRFTDARRIFQEASNEEGALWAKLGMGTAARLAGMQRNARSLGRSVEDGFRELGCEDGALAARLLRAKAAHSAGQLEKAARRYTSLLKRADRRRWLITGATLRMRLGKLMLEMGNPSEALERFDDAAHLVKYLGLEKLRRWLEAIRPAALAANGNMAGARTGLSCAPLPTPRLCASAAGAVRAGQRIVAATSEIDLARDLAKWAHRLASHGPADLESPI